MCARHLCILLIMVEADEGIHSEPLKSLNAIIVRVCDKQVQLIIENRPKRTIQQVRSVPGHTGDTSNRGSTRLSSQEQLDAMVARIGDVHIAHVIQCDTYGAVQRRRRGTR